MSGFSVRDYEDDDYVACRALWVELTEHHRRIYEDPTIGAPDPGTRFDEYLENAERAASWVAVAAADGRVVGLTGLFENPEEAVVEPVVVTESLRGQGIGELMIGRVVEEARSRGHAVLSIKPVARNVSAIRTFHAVGFRALGGFIELSMDLEPRKHKWIEGAELHGRNFSY